MSLLAPRGSRIDSTLSGTLAFYSFPKTVPPLIGWSLFGVFFHVYLYIILRLACTLFFSHKTGRRVARPCMH
jgi:hypothetical protein